MANSLVDGLNKPDDLDTAAIQTAELGSGTVLGPNISGGVILSAHLATDSVVAAKISGLAVTTAKIAANAVTAAKSTIVATGSPTGYGQSIQHGSVTPTDVETWTVFGTAFAAAPKVVVGLAVSGAAATQPPMAITVVAGSFGTIGTSGLACNWIALGSGAL